MLTGAAGEISRAVGVGLGVGLAVAALGLRGFVVAGGAALGAALVGVVAYRGWEGSRATCWAPRPSSRRRSRWSPP